jgi:hypothetical protein
MTPIMKGVSSPNGEDSSAGLIPLTNRTSERSQRLDIPEPSPGYEIQTDDGHRQPTMVRILQKLFLQMLNL